MDALGWLGELVQLTCTARAVKKNPGPRGYVLLYVFCLLTHSESMLVDSGWHTSVSPGKSALPGCGHLQPSGLSSTVLCCSGC